MNEPTVTVVQEKNLRGNLTGAFSVRINGCHIYRFFERADADSMANNIRGALDGTALKEDDNG